MPPPSWPPEPPSGKRLYAYFDNACVQAIEVQPGVWRLGLDRRGGLALAFDPASLALQLARLEVEPGGQAFIRCS
jgi:hypothetical protein